MNWPRVTLGEVFEIARGGSPRPIDNFITEDPDGYNWIMIGDAVDGSKYISSTKKRIREEGLVKTRMVDEGDFLLTNSMSFGHPYILKTSGCIHDGWLVLSPRDGNVHPDFFYYLLGSDLLYREFSKRAAGAVVKNLNTALVRSVDIVLPPLAEQKRIARILDAADALRAKRREALAQLDTLLKSSFLDMFGDPVTNPMGWEQRAAKESNSNVQIGPFGSLLHKEDYVVGGVPLVNPMHIVAGQIRVGDEQTVPEQKAATLASYRLRSGDVIMGRRGEMGRCAIVSAGEAGMLCGTGSLFIRPDPDELTSRFLSSLLSSEPMKRHLEGLSQGVTMPNLNRTMIENLNLLLPPLDLQRHFAAIVESVEQQKSRMRAHLAELDALFASLQSRAFNGEL